MVIVSILNVDANELEVRRDFAEPPTARRYRRFSDIKTDIMPRTIKVIHEMSGNTACAASNVQHTIVRSKAGVIYELGEDLLADFVIIATSDVVYRL